MRDLYNNLKVVKAKNSAQVTGTGEGIVIDTAGFGSILFILSTAAITTADGSNHFAFSIEEGNVADGSDMAAITDTDRILGTLPVINHATNFDDVTLKFGALIGTKRYMRLKWTETGTADGVFGATAVLGNPNHAPVA